MSGAVVLSLASAPVMAQAAERASAPVSEESQLNSTAWFAIIAAIAVVILAVVAANKDHNDPVSA